MALSGTYYGPWLGSGYQRVYLTWSATQNVANNTSTITASLVWDNTSGSSLSSSVSKTANITIDGTTYSGSGTVGIAGGTAKTIMTASKTITHNADGTRSFSISGAFDIKFTLGGTYYASTSASGTGTLDSIARATAPTLSAGTTQMGSVVTIYTPRASDSFTHNLTYVFGGASLVFATGVGTSYAWTIPLSLANQIPNAVSGYGTIYCDTYNGSTHIGTKTINFTATVPASVVPSASLAISGVDLYSGYYVQNKSRVTVTTHASGAYSSKISTISMTVKSGANLIGSSGSTSFTTGVIPFSGTIAIATTVTDSRGRTASNSTTISVVAYSDPRITGFNVFRSNADGTPNPQGAYMKIEGSTSISTINNKNGKYSSLSYRERGTTNWTLAGENGAVFAPSMTSIVSADVNKSYEVRVYAGDSFTSTSQIANIGTAFVLMDFHSSGNGMAIGKVAEGLGVLDIAGDVYINGNSMNSRYVYPYQVPYSDMESLTDEIRVVLPFFVGSNSIFLVTIRACPNPGGSNLYRGNYVGILSAPGKYNGSIVIHAPEWTQLSTHHGQNPLTVTPYARYYATGELTNAVQGGWISEACNYVISIKGFSTGYPTLLARNIQVMVKQLY